MKLTDLLSMEPSPMKTVSLAAWIQALYAEEGDPPVLVGGAAVELYTGGAYATGDLDFVGEVPPAVQRKMLEAGFRKEGRHWLHEEGQVFLEFPARSLDHGCRPVLFKSGRFKIWIIGPEALLVDRLKSLVFWHHREGGANAFALAWAQRRVLSPREVRRLAVDTEVDRAFEGLWSLIQRAGAVPPSEAAVGRWIEEYAP
jgi:hypothetical protein